MSAHHHKLLVLGMVPVLAFRNARLGDVHRELPAVGSTDNLCKTAAVVHIHLQGIAEPFFRQV